MSNESSLIGVPNWENRSLFWGDNLDVLRAMNTASVDLIATDPPFNKGRDFHATPDSLANGASFQDRWSWRDDVDQEWVDLISDDFPHVMNVINGARSSYGDDMGAFLCFMAVRLLAMERLLKPTGSIFLHCDPTASHYLKALMDAIFGRKNFQNEIVWWYNSGGGSKKRFGRKHDVILFYSKSEKFTFNTDAARVPYSASISKSRAHLFNENGKVMPDVWDVSRPPNHSKEWIGYPTQKPIKLYERIIESASNRGDIVLDPFCGCATTLVAAEKLERQWVGIDIWEGAPEAVLGRLRQLGLINDPTLGNDFIFDSGAFHIRKDLPVRTDDGEIESPYLRVKKRVREPEGSKRMSRAEIYEILLSDSGMMCQGCDRKFDDVRYLELDHNTPRSDGGLNHISNRVLLCSPCNRAKSNQYTLSGLRRLNKANGWMVKS